MSRPLIERMSPFFVVGSVVRSMGFYCDMLGFEIWHQEPDADPFFAIVGRDGAMLLIKAGNAEPLPNSRRNRDMRWDAYLSVPDPDALSSEFLNRGVSFTSALQDTHDGLRGFELSDPDGYILFFGRPR